jgi:hypothetical protein
LRSWRSGRRCGCRRPGGWSGCPKRWWRGRCGGRATSWRSSPAGWRMLRLARCPGPPMIRRCGHWPSGRRPRPPSWPRLGRRGSAWARCGASGCATRPKGLVVWSTAGADRHRDAGGRVDGRVVAALEQAIAEATDASSRTVGWFRWRTEQWPQALAMARSVLPHRHLLAVDERLAQAAARPVIVPRSCATTARRSSPATSRHPAGFWASTSSPVMKEPRPTSRTSRRCWPRWPRCSPSSWPATPAPTWNVVAGTCRRRWCGRCWSCRNCWTNGSSRPGKTAAMMGYATRSARGGRSRRTRSTPPWLRPPATCRSRCRPRTTSSCCLRPGGQSTPTA